MRVIPTPKQAAFLLLPHREVLFGGQAGGGKSEALLLAALQYVDVPGYAALLLRRTFRDLALPGALMDRAHDWLSDTAAVWNDQAKTWTFPSGATMSFGYLEKEKDKYRYQGSEFQTVCWDELTQFPESSYTYLFSRLRRTTSVQAPLRMRSGSNPGGEGHQWVYERFIVPHGNPERLFLPAGLLENPHIKAEEYIGAMRELDELTQQQLLHGLWVTDPSRKAFNQEWWARKNRYFVDRFNRKEKIIGRYCAWDTAFKDGEENDYSACATLELMADYRIRVREVWRDKLQFPDLPTAIQAKAEQWNEDGKLREVLIEDKASGISAYQTLQRSAPDWLARRLVAFAPKGDKIQRAKQAAVWAKRDMILMPHPSDEVDWLGDFESELYAFPDSTFDDQTDAFVEGILWCENILATGWRARQAAQKEDDA